MVLTIEKRTRTSTSTPWTEWAATTESSPYTDTDLIEYRTRDDEVRIDIDMLTQGSVTSVNGKFVWSGTGVYDKLMTAVSGTVNAEFENGRITGHEYATVYLGSMQTAITQSVQFLLQKQHAESQIRLSDAQKGLVDRQKKGFDDDARQKLLKQLLDSWSVAYSVAQDDNSIPDSIKIDPIDQVCYDAMDNLGILPDSPKVNVTKKTDTNPLGVA